MSRLLVIVVAWNRPDFLRNTLTSLFNCSDRSNTDVVVIDNGSDEATRTVLEKEGRLHGVHRFAVNRGLNVAIERALTNWLAEDHAWVLISDADMEYLEPVDMATELLEQCPEIGAVSLQHSPEHSSHDEFQTHGRVWPLKWTERGCALVLRAVTLQRMRPLPVENLKDFDWWVCRDAPASLQALREPIAIQVGGARHLGWRAGDSTWQAEEIPEFAEFRD